MKKKLIAVLALAVALCAMPLSGAAAPGGGEISVIFTHDMHSHLDTETVTAGGVTAQKGGFAKLKTAIDGITARYPDSFLLDAGDFAMGTPYQTIFSTQAPELILMGALGYDATTLGNHEFDYRGPGLAKMLGAAAASGKKLPLMLEASVDWARTLADPALAENALLVRAALERVGYKDYAILEKGGARIAVFGIMGREADSFAPESGLCFLDPIARAKEVVAQIAAQGGADLIVCLSHSGTSADPEDSEDELLARAVPEIDLIISGHSHTRLDEPIIHGKTVIASCGCYTDYLGHLTLKKSGDGYALGSYELIPLDASVADDAGMRAAVETYKALVDREYMARFGLACDEVLASSGFAFTPAEDFGLTQGEDTLGNLISDSYRYAVRQAEGAAYEPVAVTVVPAGVVRGTFDEGPVTAAEVFNVSSLGIGPDGVPGYPLVSVYLTGAELRVLAEVDISVSELMQPARLYISGLAYTYNPNRLLLNRVTDVRLMTEDGTETLDDGALYRVVGGLYSCQMLGAVESKSFGLLSLVPKDKNGAPITDFEAHIVYGGGQELKEWVALAQYLRSFEPVDGVPRIPEYYAKPQGRKILADSKNLAELLKNPNKIFFLLLGAVALVLLILAALVVLAVKLTRRRKRKKALRA